MSVPNTVLDGIGLAVRPYYTRMHPDAHRALFAVMFVIGLAGGISAVVVSAWTCRATCCKTSATDGSVMYNPAAVAATAAAAQQQVAQNATTLYMNQQQQPMMAGMVQP